MDQRLSKLIDEKDVAIRQFPTFDEFQENSEKSENNEWQKPAESVEVSSSEKSPEKVAEAEESSNPSSVEAVSEATPETQKEEPKDSRAEWVKRYDYVGNGHKVEQLSHPVAPNVTAEEPPSNPVQTAQYVQTKYKLDVVGWEGGFASLTEHTEQVERPEWWKEAYNAGQNHCETMTVLEGEDWLNKKIQFLEAQKVVMLGFRSKLDLRVQNMSETARKEYQANRANQKSLGKMKVERASKAPKVEQPLGIQMAEALAKNFKTTDAKKIANMINQANAALLTLETLQYIEKKWGAK